MRILPVTLPVPRARTGSALARAVPALSFAALLCAGAARAGEVLDVSGPEIQAPSVSAPDSANGSVAPPAAMPAASPASAPDASAKAPVVEATSVEATSVEAPVVQAVGIEGPSIEGPDETVVEVDSSQSRNKDKSLALAMLYSAVLPGTGELYLHEKKDAKVFLLAEAGFWAALYFSYLARESYLAGARNYASDFAGIDASDKSVKFLETMADYRSYLEKQHRQDSYELAQQLSGKRERDYGIPPTSGNYWDFGSSANPANTRHWKAYQSQMRYYRASEVAISFAIGALAANRVVSLANTLRVYKRTSAKGLSMNVVPAIGPGYAGTFLTLRF
jgi:hypothetical protein